MRVRISPQYLLFPSMSIMCFITKSCLITNTIFWFLLYPWFSTLDVKSDNKQYLERQWYVTEMRQSCKQTSLETASVKPYPSDLFAFCFFSIDRIYHLGIFHIIHLSIIFSSYYPFVLLIIFDYFINLSSSDIAVLRHFEYLL